jgi:fibro-slime domain-containing protein
VWVFINGKLAVDIDGLHPEQTKSVTLGVVKSQELELTPGQVYELALFHAERRPGQSNFKLTLSGFLDKKSKCTAN